MSVKELEERIQALPARELARLSRWFENYRRRALGQRSGEDKRGDNLTEAQRAELLRRVEFAKAHPEALQPWDGTTDRIRQHLHGLRAQKAARSRSRS